MLPDTNRYPTSVFQVPVGVCIACPVLLDLRTPEVRIGLGPGPVNWAPVPEAAVDENGNPRRTECHICVAPKAINWLDAYPISQT